MVGSRNTVSADSPCEPNYLGLGLYRPVLEINDPVRELNYPAPELNDLDLELELFLRESGESSISIRGLKIVFKLVQTSKRIVACVNRVWNLNISSLTDIRLVNPPF